MAGPIPMTLGRFQFEALPNDAMAFDEQSKDLQTQWASQDTAFRLNNQQFTGPQEDAFEIAGVLFPHYFGGLRSLQGIESAAKNGEPLMLVTGAGGVYGMHTIQGVSRGHETIDRTGLPHKVPYSISLLAYENRPSASPVQFIQSLI